MKNASASPSSGHARGGHEERISKHILRLEPPDVFHTTFIGDISATDMVQYYAAITRFAEGKRWVLGMIDMTLVGTSTHEARQAGSHSPRIIRGSVMYGASFKQRMGTSLLYRAATLFRDKSEVTLGFVDTEAQAREWVAERRMELERGERAVVS
jgi:hypothetical protein